MRGDIGITQDASLVGEPEYVGIVHDAAGRLHPADHHEVVLVAVKPGQEDDTGFVVLRRRLKDTSREWHRGSEDFGDTHRGRHRQAEPELPTPPAL